jgi:hypothetical protein
MTDARPIDAGAKHEPDRVPTRLVVGAAVALLLVIAATQATVWALLPRSSVIPEAAAVADTPALRDWGPGGVEQLRRLREREARNLGTTEWLDQSRSAARIPIERAMEILAAQRAPTIEGGRQ